MERIAEQDVPKRWTRRSLLLALAGMGLSVPACTWNELFSWNGGKPVLFGYGTTPNYDRRFKSVRVKIFKNPTFWAVVPVPGLEMELTMALVREIEQKTPYKVVSGDADTEISGSIKSFQKINLNYNQLNEVRECETTLTVDVVWKNVRTGELLTTPSQRAVDPPPPAGLLPNQLDPLNAPAAGPGIMQAPLASAPNTPGGQPATMADSAATPGVPIPGGTSVPGSPGAPPVPGVVAGGPGASPVLGAIVRSVAHFRPEIGESISVAQQRNVNRMAEQIVSMMEIPW